MYSDGKIRNKFTINIIKIITHYKRPILLHPLTDERSLFMCPKGIVNGYRLEYMLEPCQVFILIMGIDDQMEGSAIIAIPQIPQHFDDSLVLYLKGVVKHNKSSKLHILLKEFSIYLFELLFSVLQYFTFFCTDSLLLKALEQQTLHFLPLINKALSEGCIYG